MKNALNNFALSMVGLLVVGGLWTFLGLNVAPDLPSPLKTWQESKQYILSPWEKRGEMDQGIGTPLGFMLGSSPLFFKNVRPYHPTLEASHRSH